jgi:hypothetical protein
MPYAVGARRKRLGLRFEGIDGRDHGCDLVARKASSSTNAPRRPRVGLRAPDAAEGRRS